nr:hypothetical protein [Streptomyces europaeiscabiei]
MADQDREQKPGAADQGSPRQHQNRDSERETGRPRALKGDSPASSWLCSALLILVKARNPVGEKRYAANDQ